MTQQENAVRALFDAMGRGDAEGIRAVMHEDVVWTVMAQGIPNGGDHLGRDAIVDDFLSGAFSRFVEGGPRIIIENLIVLGDQVAVEARSDAPLHNGRRYQNRFAWFFKVREGRLASVHEYVDTRYAIETFGAPKQ